MSGFVAGTSMLGDATSIQISVDIAKKKTTGEKDVSIMRLNNTGDQMDVEGFDVGIATDYSKISEIWIQIQDEFVGKKSSSCPRVNFKYGSMGNKGLNIFNAYVMYKLYTDTYPDNTHLQLFLLIE